MESGVEHFNGEKVTFMVENCMLIMEQSLQKLSMHHLLESVQDLYSVPYINDLQVSLNISKHWLYADDANILYISGTCIAQLNECINDDLSHLTLWVKANKLRSYSSKPTVLF